MKRELPPTPQPLAQPDFNQLIAEVISCVELIASGECHYDGDFDRYFFEKSVEAVYGEGIFDWVNQVIEVDDD